MKFTLSMNEELHEYIRKKAKDNGRSVGKQYEWMLKQCRALD